MSHAFEYARCVDAGADDQTRDSTGMLHHKSRQVVDSTMDSNDNMDAHLMEPALDNFFRWVLWNGSGVPLVSACTHRR